MEHFEKAIQEAEKQHNSHALGDIERTTDLFVADWGADIQSGLYCHLTGEDAIDEASDKDR